MTHHTPALALPLPLDAIRRAVAEQRRQGRMNTARVSLLAAEIERVAAWMAEQPGMPVIHISDMTTLSTALAEIAGSADA